MPASRDTLPQPGDYDGPLFGEFGVLATDGDRVLCHMCGAGFRLLVNHVWRTHHVTADGTARSSGLPPSTVWSGRSEIHATRQHGLLIGAHTASGYGRPWRLRWTQRPRRPRATADSGQ